MTKKIKMKDLLKDKLSEKVDKSKFINSSEKNMEFVGVAIEYDDVFS